MDGKRNGKQKNVVIGSSSTDISQEIPIPAADDSLMEIDIMAKQHEKRTVRRSTLLSTFLCHERDMISREEWEDKISRTSSATPSQSAAASTSTSSSIASRESRREEVIRKSVSNFDDYKDSLKNYDCTKSLYIFFTGTSSPESGYSWCKDCRKAYPIIERALKRIHTSIFLIVNVGLQEEWEDKLNPFRLDKRTKLKVIPTLWKFRTPRRLEGKYCMKRELLELLFEDDVDDF